MARRLTLLPCVALVAGLAFLARTPQVVGALGRALPGPSVALAAEQPAPAAPAHAPAPAPVSAPAPTLAPAAPAAAFDPDTLTAGEIDVLQNLSRRRAEIEARARELDSREALVAAAEARVDQKLAEIKAVEARVTAAEASRTAEEDAQLGRLVKVYETMKPADAAAIFNTLDFPVLIQVARRMKEAKIAPVLAAMDPQAAKALTVALARPQGASTQTPQPAAAITVPAPTSAPAPTAGGNG